MHSMFVPSARGIIVGFCGPRRRCSQIRDLCALSNARCASVSRMGCIVCIRPCSSCCYVFAAILRSSMLLLVLCAHIYCRDPPQIADLARRRRPSNIRCTSSSLHRVASFCVRTRFPVPVQWLYSRGILVRAPRDSTDSEWKRSEAQRQVIGLLVQVCVRLHRLCRSFGPGSAILLYCCSVVFCVRIHCPRPTDSLERI